MMLFTQVCHTGESSNHRNSYLPSSKSNPADHLGFWVQVFRWVDAKKTISLHFYMTRIVPVGLFMALTLHFGNVVYLYLTVSFIQMLKVRFHPPSVTVGRNVWESWLDDLPPNVPSPRVEHAGNSFSLRHIGHARTTSASVGSRAGLHSIKDL